MRENKNKDLRICIAGAGMGGLTAALALAKQGFNHIDVYEMAPDLGFVGAGIQLAPNMARILDRLGCWSDVVKEAVLLDNTSVRKDATEEELTNVDLTYIKKEYGYPHMVGHRSSLATSIYEACRREKSITFHFSSPVSELLSFTPSPSIRISPRSDSGPLEPYTVTSDILLAADGIKSLIRTALLNALPPSPSTSVSASVSASIIDTGQSAYRIMLTREQIASAAGDNSDLLALLDSNTATRWIGEKRHIIAYPVSNKQIYNMSSAQPDTNFAAAPSATYTTRGSKSDMLKVFHDFGPRVQKLLNLVPEGEVCEWKLRVHAPLPTWLHGRVALLGDACHPTLPHLAQGAAQAIEDAAVLGVALGSLPSGASEASVAGQDGDGDPIERALRGYEGIRKARAERMVEMAAASGRALHLGEGEAREQRDREFREASERDAAAANGDRDRDGDGKGVGGKRVPDKWADAEVQRMIYGHDCVRVAEEYFREGNGVAGDGVGAEALGV
ncbi:MAG: hypothetical protein Q9160_008233 [Pyrenula sp. 1 TL-2023]